MADISNRPDPRTIRQPAPVQQVLSAPFWQGRERTGGTYTAATDWNGQFDDNNATNAVDFDIPTATGWVVFCPSSSQPTRLRLSFETPYAFSIPINLVADNWGANTVQVRINGAGTDYSADTRETWNFQVGRNQIDLMTNGTPDRIELRATLFGRAGVQWINPYAD